MNLLIIVIFLQIVLESLPVSSSGHLFLIQNYLGKLELPQFWDYFLHGPTILILMSLFFKQWFFPAKNLIKGFFYRSFSKKDSYKKLLKVFYKILVLVFVATLITMFFWVLVKFGLEKKVWFSDLSTLLVGFFITTIFLFSLFFKKSIYGEKLDFKKAVILGFVQGIALIPGVSRFGIVYSTCRILKICPRRAFEITFLLQFPLIVAGFFLGLYNFVQVDGWYNLFTWDLNLAIILATIISFFVLSFMRMLARKQKIWMFGFYILFLIVLILIHNY